MVRIKLFVIIINLICFNSLFAADNTPLGDFYKRHASVRDALRSYNQVRIERSQLFEDSVGEQKIADDLPERLFDIVSRVPNGEFCERESVAELFREINPSLGVTGVTILKGGFVSGKIYRIMSVHNETAQQEVFYLKYLRSKPILVSKGRIYGEELNLQYLAQAEHVEAMQHHLDIMLPIASYEYRFDKNRKVFMVIPEAKGASLSNIVADQDLESVNQAFTALGCALGKVHTELNIFDERNNVRSPKTVNDFINVKVPSHGDLHGDNVFYDTTTQRLSLIDVETMANSFDENGQPTSPICYDMLYMLLMSSKKFGKFMPDNDWEPFEKMFQAYVEQYPMEQRKGLYSYLIYCLQHVEKIKFVDIFKSFNFKKGFSKGAIKGAKIVAKGLDELKYKHIRQLNAGRNFSDEFKMYTEQRYSPKGLRSVSMSSKTSGPDQLLSSSDDESGDEYDKVTSSGDESSFEQETGSEPKILIGRVSELTKKFEGIAIDGRPLPIVMKRD